MGWNGSSGPKVGGWAVNLGLGGTLESWAPHETYNTQNRVESSCGGVGALCGGPLEHSMGM